MKKQSKSIYVALMDKIAVAMLVNQGAMIILGMMVEGLEMLFFGAGDVPKFYDIIFKALECAAYFFSFVIPIAVFNKMNKNAEKEIYEPVESEKIPNIQGFALIGISLGVIMLVAYLNDFLVNIFWDYSSIFDNLWLTPLDYPYQRIFYFIYTAIIPAIAEEYFFRFTLCRSMKAWGKRSAIVISAVLFSMMHTNIGQSLYTLVAGLLLAYVYLETDNIAFPIAIHLLNNGIPTVGEIVGKKYGEITYESYVKYTDAALLMVGLVCAVFFVRYVVKRGTLVEKLILKKDENEEEVAPLSLGERVSGFFSRGMTVFVIYSVIMTVSFILMSVGIYG